MRPRHQRSSVPAADAAARVVCGANPVRELLEAAPAAIEVVLVLPSARAASGVSELARSRGVKVEMVDRAGLDRVTGGAHHQGVAARTRGFAYVPFEDVLGAGKPLLVALDGITDPQNLGAIIRSAEVLGAGGMILPRDRAAGVTPAAMRASSGASAHLPIAQVVNLARALAAAKERGYWIVGMDVEGSVEFQALPALDRVVLVVGGEERGARPLVLRGCDFLVRVPTPGRVASLNAAAAAAIGLYALRSRLAGAVEGKAPPPKGADRDPG